MTASPFITSSHHTPNNKPFYDIKLQLLSSPIGIMTCDMDTLRVNIQEAEKEVDVAERHLKNSQIKLQFLQKQLQDLMISGVGGLKAVTETPVVIANKPPENEDEAARKARVRRRWRVLGMKIKFGLGAQVMATKRRNLSDASSFIEKESEVFS